MNWTCKIIIVAALIVCSLARPASAGCILEQAMSQLEFYNIHLNADIATRIKPILDEQTAIGDKAKNPNLPIGPQISPQDVNRFNELRSELLILQANKLNNSGYLRDARVIAKMSKVAEAVRRGRSYGDNDPDIFYFRMLVMAYLATSSDGDLSVAPGREGECSVDTGLLLSEQTMLNSSDLKGGAEAGERLAALSKQYGLKMDKWEWVEQIPVLSVKKTARIDVLKAQELVNVRDYIKAMEALRALNAVSIEMFSANQEDVHAAKDGNDLAARFGKTWDAQVKASDKKTQSLDILLQLIGKSVPSDSMIETQQLGDVAKKVQ
jgi:hypothetical protein